MENVTFVTRQRCHRVLILKIDQAYHASQCLSILFITHLRSHLCVCLSPQPFNLPYGVPPAIDITLVVCTAEICSESLQATIRAEIDRNKDELAPDVDTDEQVTICMVRGQDCLHRVAVCVLIDSIGCQKGI